MGPNRAESGGGAIAAREPDGDWHGRHPAPLSKPGGWRKGMGIGSGHARPASSGIVSSGSIGVQGDKPIKLGGMGDILASLIGFEGDKPIKLGGMGDILASSIGFEGGKPIKLGGIREIWSSSIGGGADDRRAVRPGPVRVDPMVRGRVGGGGVEARRPARARGGRGREGRPSSRAARRSLEITQIGRAHV